MSAFSHAMAPFVAMLRRPGMRRRNSKALAARTVGGVDRAEWIELGGVPQWVTIRSARSGNPVLLVIHGGPASPYTPFNPQLASWERHFTVVQWDQRGAGRTFIRNGADQQLSVDRIATDGIELARLLRADFARPIVLMGSSVGTVIAQMMVANAPDLFDWYIGANQVGIHSRTASWRATREELVQRGQSRGIAALDAFGEDPRKWSGAQAEEVSKVAISATTGVPDMVYDLMLPALMYTPDYTMSDIKLIGQSMEIARDALYEELADPEPAVTWNIPVLLVHGAKDLVNPLSAVRALMAEIDAPQLDLEVVEQAGHLVEFADVDGFARILEERVLPRLPV